MSLKTLATLEEKNLYMALCPENQAAPDTEGLSPLLLAPPPPGFHIYFITVDSKLQQRREQRAPSFKR